MNFTSEEVLVKECIAGNRAYQEMLYRKFSRRMLGVCYRYARNKEEAEDCLQDAFVRVFKNLQQYKATGSLEGWVKRIVINTILENMRKKSMMYKVVDMEEAFDETGHDDLLDNINIQDLVKLIQALAPGYRAVFNLFAIEGYTHREIAKQLGITEGTSKSQYACARKILRRKLKEQSEEISIRT